MMNHHDILMATEPVTQAFDALHIPYYIGGSVASSTYGMARATMDVDIVADIIVAHIRPFIKQLEQSYYLDEGMIVNAIARKSSFNLIHLETMIKVDIFVLKNEPYHHTMIERRRIDSLEDGENATRFYFVSAEDSILSKLEWYRMGGEISERQWGDILGIIKVQRHLLDRVYLERWAKQLRLQQLLHRAFNEAEIN